MQIIPVIDLKNGQVVHAAQGNRDCYQPIQSPLSQSASIEDVISAFLGLYPFRKFYIADLNALTGTGDHIDLVSKILMRYPEAVFWVDAGFNTSLRHYARFDNFVPVIGSESLRQSDLPLLNDLNKAFILSLDFAGDRLLGADDIFHNHRIWPETVIIMTLSQVGSNCGPDFQKLKDYCKRFSDKKFVAAGGVRDKEDLLNLEKIGVHSSLIASALHSGAITAGDIAGIC